MIQKPPWSCKRTLWAELLAELAKRSRGERESGAFLLGIDQQIDRIVYFDDLVPDCNATGIIRFPGTGYSPLWDMCSRHQCTVVADVHTHELLARQSPLDRCNPMIARQGHLGIIVPWFSLVSVPLSDFGFYEYRGSHRWFNHSGPRATTIFQLT